MPEDKPAPDDEAKIFHPPNTLAKKTKKVAGTVDDLLANASTMLERMKDEFGEEVEAALARLPVIFSQQWTNEETRAQGIAAFSAAANDLKGQAGSFDFPLLGTVADLFRDYLVDTPAPAQKPAAILSYIETMKIVWTRRISGDGGAIGRQIVADLLTLNEKAATRAGGSSSSAVGD